ncbi:DUF1573 domain-containing protein [Fibrella aquatica]|jgi:Protein of unknown function (DUF1573)|uniref:DUF1573 domain-containing protein n=1 Tax=Fibrella aquatica TaxID=3242487 RepID=UPI0035209D3A
MTLFNACKYTSFLLVYFIFFGCQSPQTTEGLVVNDSLNLGVLKKGDQVPFTVNLTNPTTDYVRIVSVKGDCGCITVNKSPEGLKPGQNGIVNATYNSKVDEKLTGTILKNIVIQVDKKPFIHAVKLTVALN